ncbi:MAG: hypothetical protein V3W43_18410, partial [Desulfatiglandaceae bacterium]
KCFLQPIANLGPSEIENKRAFHPSTFSELRAFWPAIAPGRTTRSRETPEYLGDSVTLAMPVHLLGPLYRHLSLVR